MTLTPFMQRFRHASRDLWNHYFLLPAPDDVSDVLCAFDSVQEALFRALVLFPAGLADIRYGLEQPCIRVVIDSEYGVPAMINRAEDSGYWDYPVTSLGREAHLRFIAYFDWNQFHLRDNQYVRAVIRSHPVPALVGKHVLLDARYLSFEPVA